MKTFANAFNISSIQWRFGLFFEFERDCGFEDLE